MANSDGPFGLRPLEYLDGSPWNGQARRYYIAAALNETIYIGDPVVLAGAADALGMYPTVKLATLAATNYTIGPVVAFEPAGTNLETRHHPALTAQYCWVADDPNIIFEIQMDSATTLEADDVGSNGIMVRTHTTVNGVSGVEADESSFSGADATEMLLLLGLVDRDDNELGQHCKVKVLISGQMHIYNAGLGV